MIYRVYIYIGNSSMYIIIYTYRKFYHFFSEGVCYMYLSPYVYIYIYIYTHHISYSYKHKIIITEIFLTQVITVIMIYDHYIPQSISLTLSSVVSAFPDMFIVQGQHHRSIRGFERLSYTTRPGSGHGTVACHSRAGGQIGIWITNPHLTCDDIWYMWYIYIWYMW